MGTKTLKQWEEILLPEEIQALHDTYHPDPEAITPNEALDSIVEWNGGIATGRHIRSIISRVYGGAKIMAAKTIHSAQLCDQVKDEILEKYRNSIPRKAFIEAIDRIKTDLMKEES